MARYSDIYGSVIVRGLEVPIVGEATIVYNDESFSHAFGTWRGGNYMVEQVDDIQVDGNTKDLVAEYLHNIGLTNHNRRFKKNIRRLVKLINKTVYDLDYSAFTKFEQSRAVDSAIDSDPD